MLPNDAMIRFRPLLKVGANSPQYFACLRRKVDLNLGNGVPTAL